MEIFSMIVAIAMLLFTMVTIGKRIRKVYSKHTKLYLAIWAVISAAVYSFFMSNIWSHYSGLDRSILMLTSVLNSMAWYGLWQFIVWDESIKGIVATLLVLPIIFILC